MPRRRVERVLAAGALASGLAACSADLFHDTGWKTRCEADPSSCTASTGTSAGGAGGEGGSGGAGGGAGTGGTGGAGGGAPLLPWSRRYGDAGDQVGTSVAIGAGGHVLVSGRFMANLDLGLATGALTSAGDYDLFLAELDASGTTLRGQRFGDLSPQVSTGIAVDAQGRVAWTGYFAGAVDFGAGAALTSAGGQDLFVTKLDTDGAPSFAVGFGDAVNQRANAVAAGPNAVYAAGSFAGTIPVDVDTTLATQGGQDVFILALDGSGVPQWARSFGSAGAQIATAVAATPAGDVLVAGTYVGALDLGGGALPASVGERIFVASFDATGAHRWSRDLGATTSATPPAIASDAGGNALVAGGFAGASDLNGGTTSAGGMDAFIAKLDGLTGAETWAMSFGDADEQSATAIAADEQGDVVVAIALAGSITVNGGPVASAGLDDVLLVRVSAAGTVLAHERFGDAGEQRPEAIAPEGGGVVVVTGAFDGTLDFGDGDGPLVAAGVAGTNDIFVAQLTL